MQYWFYVSTGGMTSTDSEGKTHTRYPLASMMTSMKHSTQGTLGLGTSEGHEACDKAFAWPIGTPEVGIWWWRW